MLLLVAPLLAGVVLATQFSIPFLYVLLLIFFSAALFMWLRIKLLIYPLLLGFGAFLVLLRVPSGELEGVSEARVILKIEEPQVAKIISIYSETEEQWHRCNHKVLLVSGFDSLGYSITAARVGISPINQAYSNYFRMLHNQQVRYIVRLRELHDTAEKSPPLSTRMNRWAVDRLKLLSLDNEAFALTAAMALARRDLLDETTVQAYRGSGTSHIMALSGMHMAIVLLLSWGLFIPFAVVNRGYSISCICSILAIWLFAFVAGLGDSILRAAWMFTLLQLSLLLSRRYVSLNSLCTAFLIMVCCDPFAIYDLGFQLSFICVAAIIFIGSPITRRIRTHIFILDKAADSLIISCVATIAIMPLISQIFGYITLLSPLSTLLLLPTLVVIVSMALLWILFPLPFLAPVFRTVIEAASVIQNYIAELFSSLGWGSFEVQISQTEMLLCYLFYLLLFLVYKIVSGLFNTSSQIKSGMK